MAEIPTEFNEARERASEAAEKNDPFITLVSITIALLAVITAVIGSVESLETAHAILESNNVIREQTLASDQWNFYQAKGIKKRIDELTADGGGKNAEKAAENAKREAEDQKEISAKAKEFEKARDEAREAAEKHEGRHPKLTLAAAMLQISIAVSTISIITRRKWPWAVSVLLGLAGAAWAAFAFVG
ncbi:MAG: DUF4337 family protein [Pseudomonadota bacterium]